MWLIIWWAGERPLDLDFAHLEGLGAFRELGRETVGAVGELLGLGDHLLLPAAALELRTTRSRPGHRVCE